MHKPEDGSKTRVAAKALAIDRKIFQLNSCTLKEAENYFDFIGADCRKNPQNSET